MMGKLAKTVSRAFTGAVARIDWPVLFVLLVLALPGCDPESGELAWGGDETKPLPERTLEQSRPVKPIWKSLAVDGLHDPSNPALHLLQDPATALSELPRAQEGNNVDWVAALRSGDINPRTNIFPETKITVLDLDILMEDTAGMPVVLFPHRPHTEWLDCKNCHDRIFVAKRGANPVNMFAILQGDFCGQCHGAVSFPLTQCKRCHSVDRPTKAQRSGAAG
jgi:c(7)-type cytochrome triheme protein